MTTVFPPHRIHSSTRISASHALFLLSAYLAATENNAYLHPNALLTENGPIAPSTGDVSGLVIHNLRRVEAGLRGQHLAPEEKDSLGVEDEARDGQTEMGMQVVGDTESQPVLEMDGQWQDKEEYEREQDVMDGDIGSRGRTLDGKTEEQGGEVPSVKVSRSKLEKNSRKEDKKQRRKEAKRRRHEQLQREKDAEV
ncbi:hypothetical protein MMC21_004042 [Puttea exsequens]|nr:hypothetical protein [Puttea exsequens]